MRSLGVSSVERVVGTLPMPHEREIPPCTIEQLGRWQLAYHAEAAKLKNVPPPGERGCYCNKLHRAGHRYAICSSCKKYPDLPFCMDFMRFARVVYFITTPIGFCKIGSTSNIVTRMASLQSSQAQRLSLRAFLHGDYGLEYKMHIAFSRLRASGEWFHKGDIVVRSAVEDFGAIKVIG